MPHEAILNHVTSLTFKTLLTKDIVTPEQYRAKFHEFLLKQGVLNEYSDGDLVQDVVNMTLENAQAIMDKTNSTLGDLDGYVRIAQEAIASKDTGSLNGILNLIHVMQSEIHQLRNEVYLDGLTRIYNRKWLFDKLLDKQGTLNHSGAMAFVDVNGFKLLNDTLGHDVGDRILTHMGKCLNDAVLRRFSPESLHVIRYAGDEFALIGSVSKESLLRLLQFTQTSMAKKTFRSKKDTFKMSFAFGVTSFQIGEEFMCVLKRADSAMYKNKKILKEKAKHE